MSLTDEQREIVVHFVRHMPEAKRALFEGQVLKVLKNTEVLNENLDQAMRATCACIDTMWRMWSQARLRY